MEKKKLLVVDDSPTMRNLLTFHLKRIPNIQIQEAENGVDALGKLQEGAFDLIVTDINMPVMDGLKFISAVRGEAKTKDLPIIIITTKGQDEDRKRGLELGADAYIAKPINSINLIDVTTRLLQGT
ncbi:MAG: response regulator [Acidobacteriota bacterium]